MPEQVSDQCMLRNRDKLGIVVLKEGISFLVKLFLYFGLTFSFEKVRDVVAAEYI